MGPEGGAARPWLEADWPAPPRVRALCTTRCTARASEGRLEAGPGRGDWWPPGASESGLDLGREAHRAWLREALGLPLEPAWLCQVHGATVVEARPGGGQEADGSWTLRPGLACTALAADCLPVLLCDRAGRAVGAAHAGWRGLAAGVLEALVGALARALGAEAGEAGLLLAWLGPCIGAGAFEVGPEVREALLAGDPGGSGCLRPRRPGRWLADLPALARRRLEALGVGVHGGRWCTWSEPGRFHSYRREGRRAGRQAALVWLEPSGAAEG